MTTQNPPPYSSWERPLPPSRCAAGASKGCLIAAGITLVCVVLVSITFFLFLLGFGMLSSGSSLGMTKRVYTDQYLSGDQYSRDKIVVIDISGIILSGDYGWGQVASSVAICEQIDQARRDKNVKAVILRLNTPGGEVTASDLIHHKVLQLRQEGKPVVAAMESLAASGGLYVAVATDYIVAHRLTTTGSIGVIAQTFNYHQLLQKIGLQKEVYKSGPMKDLLDGSRPRTEAEKELITEIIQEVYDDFVRIVAEGRKKITENDIRNTELGDGRILSGRQALKYGLVDQLGFFEDAVEKTAELAKLDKYKVVEYQAPFSFVDILQGVRSPSPGIKVELPGSSPWQGALEPGKLYFLPNF